ncbi:hypothetical protein A7X63_16295 [Stenotrophomonas maltophilia]|jgi:hypothetical protein|nr:hypothetical protein [Stenotrophomonas maltophilia]MBA0319951.1 hypothetical protein [Stenotrophomonas maltophilia]MBA0401440.1 hypothetical protein [Stenotrophomonas maltophilia]PJL52735.1 hypothetical protein B9Y73_09770 [Stenotrophomonas maltophilia]PJL55745.1 hypothetical protein B9Y60_09775 [Stenotrophomonas maltophilia]
MMSVIPVSHALPYSEVRPQKEHSAQAPAHGLILGGAAQGVAPAGRLSALASVRGEGRRGAPYQPPQAQLIA